MPVVKIGSDNKVSVPKEVLERLGVKPGDFVQAEFERVEDVPYTDEVLGPEARAALREAQEDVKAGRVHGPFDSAEEAIAHLRATPPDANPKHSP